MEVKSLDDGTIMLNQGQLNIMIIFYSCFLVSLNSLMKKNIAEKTNSWISRC